MNKAKIKKDVEKYAFEWQKKLLLTHWNLEISWEKDRSDDEAAAWVKRVEDYARAYIYVHEETFFETYTEWGKEKAFQYVLHELVHVLLADYDYLMRARFITQPEYTSVRERTTEQLTRILSSI